MIETLEELRDLRATHNKIDVAQSVLEMNAEEVAEALRRRAEMEQEEDEQFVRSDPSPCRHLSTLAVGKGKGKELPRKGKLTQHCG